MQEKLKMPYTLSVLLTILVFLQSILGLLLQGEYRDVDWIKAAWVGNDWVTLLVAVPLMIIALIYIRQGSVRGLLIWFGLLGYAVYNYAYYLFGAALNAFFPIYVIALVLSVVILLPLVSRTDVTDVAARFSPKSPVRIMGGYLVFVGVGLGSVWLIMWAAYIFTGTPTPIETEAFKVVAAIDISVIVPLLVFGGVLLWLRKVWGYVIASMASILGAIYLVVLSVNSYVAIQRGLTEAPGELPIWGTLALLTTVVTILLLSNVK